MLFAQGEVEIPVQPYDRAIQLQTIMVARATGSQSESNQLFVSLRNALMEDDDPILRESLPQVVRVCSSLNQFWGFIQPKFGKYAERRIYLYEEFSPLLGYLENRSNTPVDDLLDDALKDFSVTEVRRAWRKAVMKLENDPEGAITAARALVESVCKYVLEEVGEQCEDMDKIYRQVSQLMNLAPDQQSEQAFKQLSGACNSIVGSVNEIRNKLGDAHGHGSLEPHPLPRHAELAVNVAGSLAVFIVRTRLEDGLS